MQEVQSKAEDPKIARKVRSFVRRLGRLTPAQQKAIELLWPQWGLSRSAGVMDWPKVFGSSAPVFLEIGFGMGRSLSQMAKERPEDNFVGVEVYKPGVGALLRDIDAQALENVRVFEDDATEVLSQSIAPQSLDGIYVLFPDPWHKARHNKRRLIQSEFVKVLSKALKPDGFLHIATDWAPYAEHCDEVLQSELSLRNRFAPSSWAPKEYGRVATKYQARGERLGHEVFDLIYDKVAS